MTALDTSELSLTILTQTDLGSLIITTVTPVWQLSYLNAVKIQFRSTMTRTVYRECSHGYGPHSKVIKSLQ